MAAPIIVPAAKPPMSPAATPPPSPARTGVVEALAKTSAAIAADTIDNLVIFWPRGPNTPRSQ
jgi:hypothetical protein